MAQQRTGFVDCGLQGLARSLVHFLSHECFSGSDAGGELLLCSIETVADVFQSEMVNREPVARGAFGTETNLHFLADQDEFQVVVISHCDSLCVVVGKDPGTALCHFGCVFLNILGHGLQTVSSRLHVHEFLIDFSIPHCTTASCPTFDIICTFLDVKDVIGLQAHTRLCPACEVTRLETRIHDLRGKVERLISTGVGAAIFIFSILQGGDGISMLLCCG